MSELSNLAHSRTSAFDYATAAAAKKHTADDQRAQKHLGHKFISCISVLHFPYSMNPGVAAQNLTRSVKASASAVLKMCNDGMLCVVRAFCLSVESCLQGRDRMLRMRTYYCPHGAVSAEAVLLLNCRRDVPVSTMVFSPKFIGWTNGNRSCPNPGTINAYIRIGIRCPAWCMIYLQIVPLSVVHNFSLSAKTMGFGYSSFLTSPMLSFRDEISLSSHNMSDARLSTIIVSLSSFG